MANTLASIFAFLFMAGFCFCACYAQYCKTWNKIWRRLGEPDIKSIRELKALWNQRKMGAK